MSGRIFDINEEPNGPGSTPPFPSQAKPERARPPKGPRRWRPVLFTLAALLVIGAIGAGIVSVWVLRKRIQSIIAPAPAPSPTPAVPATGKTKFETFTAKYGTVLIRGSSVAGAVSGQGGTVTTEAVQLTDASTKEKTEAIVFHIVQSGYFRTPNLSVVDYDEVDSLLKGLDYVAKADPSITPLKSFEAIYKSRGGFQVFVFNDDKGKINAGVASGEITPSRVYLKLDDLAKFREQIVTAKSKLDGVRGTSEK